MAWTFGKKIAAGFGISVAMLVLVGMIAYRETDSLMENDRMVTHTHTVLEQLTLLLSAMQDAETAHRGFLVMGEDTYLEPYQSALAHIGPILSTLRGLTSDNDRQQRRLDQADALIQSKLGVIKHSIELRRTEGMLSARTELTEGKQVMDDFRRVVQAMEQEEHDLLKQRSSAAESGAKAAQFGIAAASLFALLFVGLAGWTITRSLNAQLSSATANIRSSSTELEAAATQQASGAREQSSATSEVSTTLRELLSTAKQIAESAQRVARIADDTAHGARSGDETVLRASDAVQSIKRQVDLIVAHMLDLGKKSQQVGGIVELINELAEQTNILAINATIEAAGAGDAGKRFGVVADEIRKLADRVAGSTKEIRGLIDDIRSAVNTTVMATEGGSKAVEAGSKQFVELTTSFKQIVELVGTTTEAAREIELSTKQQSTAVEQVNLAITNVAQATKENEASSNQTLQTARQLTALSRELTRMIQTDEAA
ncbi:MAG TPA: methyl-accepting chemotaxis protein [Polyangiaceae bacterium]